MTQAYLGQISDTSTESGDDLAARLNAYDTAEKSGQSGFTRPANIAGGGVWSQDNGDGSYTRMLYNGSSDVALMAVGETMTTHLVMGEGNAIKWVDTPNGGDYIRWDTGEGLKGFENGVEMWSLGSAGLRLGEGKIIQWSATAGGDYIRWETGEGLIGYENATTAFRIPSGTGSTTEFTHDVINRQRGDARYQQVSSAARFKDGIRALTLEEVTTLLAALSVVEAKTWTWGGELTGDDPRRGRAGMGAIADEMHAALPPEWREAFVIYDDAGEPYGIDAHAIVALTVASIRIQSARVADLTARVEALESA